MSRSKWKIPYIKQTNKKKIKFASRDSKILPQFVGSIFTIHNGRKNSEITITEKMLNHKFGEFFFTRSTFIFKKKKKK